MRVRLDISYDGARFHGWAAQPGLRTVQGELERALAQVLREPVVLIVAGRTDAGVHARGQVAHLDISDGAWDALPGRSDRDPGVALVRGVNAVLARQLSAVPCFEHTPRGYTDVVVKEAHAVPSDFDARFSALWRRYAYRIADTPQVWNPQRRDVLWLSSSLDLAAMNEAAAALLGEHDFLAYAKPREGASTVRTLQELRCERGDDGVITAWVQADAFCHSQVRAMMGTLLDIGRGVRPVSWAGIRLERCSHNGMVVAPAHPLTLDVVGYPENPQEFGAQAQRARVYRG